MQSGHELLPVAWEGDVVMTQRYDSLPTGHDSRIDFLCDQFESAWRAGNRPRLEDCLPQIEEADRLALVRALLNLELHYRDRLGEQASAEEYRQRLPEFAALIDSIFSRFETPSPQASSAHTPGAMPTLRSETQTPVSTVASSAPVIRGYEILGELGRGGMGVVYQARQIKANRIVALKMILTRAHAGVEQRLRFQIEAEAVARLQHPNIVQLHEVGEHDGLPFFSQEYCAGGSLAERLKAGPLSAQAAAMLVETLAQAVHYAHLRGVVHRDLKPANVLLTGEPGADATELAALVKIADFSLAKRTDADDGLSRTGAVMGTPSYMAPEQAAGQVHDTGPATDVWALGAILYELLTGRPPFLGATPQQTMQQAMSDEPATPSRHNTQVPRDLETIALKCLRKEPKSRYSSAEALAEDLRRWRTGEPIAARPVGGVERLVKWVRRRPVGAALIGLVVLLLAGTVAAAILLTYAFNKEKIARTDAESARATAEKSKEDAETARIAAERSKEEALASSDFLRNLFQTSDPLGLDGEGIRSDSRVGPDTTARQFLSVGVKKVRDKLKDQPVVRATVLDTLGRIYRNLGLYQEAEPLLTEALTLRQQHLGNDHLDTATSLHNLATLRQFEGRFREAVKLYRSALAIRQTRLGREELPTANTMFFLAWALADQYPRSDQAKLQEADELLIAVERIRRHHLGDRHPDVGTVLAARTLMTMSRSNPAQNLKNLTEALGMIVGDDSLSQQLLVTYLQSVMLRQFGKYDEAARLHRQVLERGCALTGENHPMMILLRGDLAGLLRSAGDLAGAEREIRKAIELGRSSPLRGHPLVVKAMCDFAETLARRGDVEEAASIFQETMELAFNIEDPKLIREIGQIYAQFLRQQGRGKDAAALEAKVPH